MTFWVSKNTGKIYSGKFNLPAPPLPIPHPLKMGGRGWRKFTILVAPELLIWHSLVLFRHQTQQYKQKLINLNYYGYSSITYVWPHLRNSIQDWVFLPFTGLKKVLGIIPATKTQQMLNKKVIMKEKKL